MSKFKTKIQNLNLGGVTAETWARTIWFFIGLISQFCIIFHLAPLPRQIAEVDVETLTIHITNIIAAIGEIRSWWKNNSVTEPYQGADAIAKAKEAKDMDALAIAIQNYIGELPYTEKAHQPVSDHHHEVG